jgi:hypothetical protein
MYRRAFARAWALTLANWPVLVTLFVYSVVVTSAVIVGSLLGFVGGLLVGIVWASCAGSFLYLVEMMVRTSRVSLADFRRSFGAYLWDVMGVLFLLWLFLMVVAPALASLPRGPALLLSAYLLMLVFFNAVPELIYLGHHSSLQLLRESYVFIGENWIEWFPASLGMTAVLYWISVPPLPGFLGWVQTALVALLVYFVMVVRGLLFLELHDSSRRSRIFRHRTST